MSAGRETPAAGSGGSAAWLVTGCSSGIGRHIALAALAKGHRVAVTARNPSAVADIVAEHPELAVALALDVTDREQVAGAVEATERELGGIDVLVNNAGYGYMAAIEEGEDEEVRAMFDTNYFGVVAMIKATLPGMRRREGGCLQESLQSVPAHGASLSGLLRGRLRTQCLGLAQAGDACRRM